MNAPAAAGAVRMASRIAAMVGWLLVALLLFQLWRLAHQRNPWPRRFLSGIARMAGVRIRIAGVPAAGRLLMLANHVSWLDIPALAGATGTAFVAHDGLAGVPLLKYLCELNDTLFVARHDRGSIAAQIAGLRAALTARGRLTIFPAGTTSDGIVLPPFKSALLAALDPLPQEITVQPVWLDYGAHSAEIAWVDEEAGLANVKRILARAEPITLTIHFLQPLTAAALMNRKTMAGAAHAAIVQAMALQKAEAMG